MWKPIDSAPTDGTRVLLFIGELTEPVCIGRYAKWQRFANDKLVHASERWEWDGMLPGFPSPAPTYWQAIPAPPPVETHRAVEKDRSVTPAMIEAGARAVRVYLEDTDLDSRERAETIAECVLRAARA